MKVADFGLSHLDPSVSFVPSFTGGTLGYQSPETLKSKYVTKEADIWALGVMGYELCTLTHPFVRQGQTASETKDAIIHTEPPMLPDSYSDKLRSVIFAMLRKNPKKRIGLRDLEKKLHSGLTMSSTRLAGPAMTPADSSTSLYYDTPSGNTVTSSQSSFVSSGTSYAPPDFSYPTASTIEGFSGVRTGTPEEHS